MPRPVVAVVVGFTKRAGLLSRSFAPLVKLRRDGVLDRILYVTWDSPALDPWVADAAMPEVDLVRIPEPEVCGAPYQRKFHYQTHNIREALALVPDDALVIKLRPDTVIDDAFLAAKIETFDGRGAPWQLPDDFVAAMPPSPFAARIWIPWADTNLPFFYEDGIFAALRRDADKLVTQAGDGIVDTFGDRHSKWIVHVARYVVPFLSEFAIFERYLREFRHFAQEEWFRLMVLPEFTAEAFFWHLAIANVWILATSFHVDCGRQGQIMFYPPEGSGDLYAGTPLEAIPPRPPYDQVDDWRRGQQAGSIMRSVCRVHGRLVDDSWQRSIFAPRSPSDITHAYLASMLRGIGGYRSGALREAEEAFYRLAADVYRRHFPANGRAPSAA